ncbi:MAG: peroxiredoxin family protein [Terriglobales bacterium]
MNMRRIRLGLLAALSVAIVAIRADLIRQRNALDELTGAAISPSTRITAPQGYLANGLMASGMNKAGCIVLRMVSRGCNYCRDEKARWEDFAPALEKVGCQLLGIAPNAMASLAPSDFGYGGDEQLVLFAMDWVDGYHPTIPPTTVVLGRGGKVLWYRVGEIQPGDAEEAVKAVPSPAR